MEMTESSVKSTARDFHSHIDVFENEIRKLNSLIDNVPSIWSGDDGTKFAMAFKDGLLNQYVDVIETLRKYADFLDKIPVAYDRFDESFSSKKINF